MLKPRRTVATRIYTTILRIVRPWAASIKQIMRACNVRVRLKLQYPPYYMLFQRTTSHFFWVQSSSLKGTFICPAIPCSSHPGKGHPVTGPPGACSVHHKPVYFFITNPYQNESVHEGGSRIHIFFSQPSVVKDF